MLNLNIFTISKKVIKMPSKNDRNGEIAVNTNGSKMKIIK